MRLGTPLSPTGVRVMLLGSGELGKEVVIEAIATDELGLPAGAYAFVHGAEFAPGLKAALDGASTAGP